MSARLGSNSSFSNHGYNGGAESHEDVQDLKPEQTAAGLSEEPRMGVLYVAERVDTSDLLGENLLALCGGCGVIVERYPKGLPTRLIRFRQRCGGCGSPVRREWTVLVPFGDVPDVESVQKLVTDWWDKLIWSGPSRREQFFRNWEYCDYFARIAESIGIDWTPRCPITDEPVEGGDLEFDHDDYSSNSGICCTKDAHEYVHNASYVGNDGQQGPADSQDWKAQKLGLRSGLDLKYPRRVRLHLESVDDDVLSERFVEAGGKWAYLADRLQLFVHEVEWTLEERADVAYEQYDTYCRMEEADPLTIIDRNG